MTTLKELAFELESVAKKYANEDSEARKFLNSINDILSRTKNDIVIDTEEHIPGNYWFSEGGLSKYPDLESAFSRFSLFIAMGTSEKYENLLKALDDRLIEVTRKRES